MSGAEFNSNLFKELHRLSGIKSSNTTPYHPIGDGQVERMNRTHCNMLKSFPENQKSDWKNHLPKLALAYNCTINKSTGSTGCLGDNLDYLLTQYFKLIHHTHCRNQTHKQFVNDWRNSMKEAFDIANMNIRNFKNIINIIMIRHGDKGLIRNTKEKGGTGKLKSYWDHDQQTRRNCTSILELDRLSES